MSIGDSQAIPAAHFAGGANLTERTLDGLAPVMENIRQRAIGETVAAMDLYVDPTGSDTEGKGTALAPYASFDRALAEVPMIVAHKIHIRAAAGSYTSFPSHLSKIFMGDGQITLDSTATPVASAGPFTLATYARPNYTYSTFLVTAAGWTVDEFVGKWLLITSGAAAGRAYPIHSNTADTITTPPVWTSAVGTPANPDTFEIVEPPTVITVDHGIAFSQLGNLHSATDVGTSTSSTARMGFSGIKFATTMASSQQPFSLIGGSYSLAFCTFAVPDGASASAPVFAFYAERCSVNGGYLLDRSGFDNALHSDLNVANFQTMYGAGNPAAIWTTSNYYGSKQSRAWVTGLCTRAMHLIEGGDNFTLETQTARVSYMVGSLSTMQYCHVNHGGLGAASYSGIDVQVGAFAYLSYVHIEDIAGADAISLSSSARCVVYNVSGNAANISGHAIAVSGLTRVHYYTNSTIDGTTEAIYFRGSAASSAWPAVGAKVEDLIGAICAATS